MHSLERIVVALLPRCLSIWYEHALWLHGAC